MAWTCMTSSGAGSQIFIDGRTHDGSTRNISEKFCQKTNASELIKSGFTMHHKHYQLSQRGKGDGLGLAKSNIRS